MQIQSSPRAPAPQPSKPSADDEVRLIGPEPAGVQEVHLLQVQHQLVPTGTDQICQCRTQLRCGGSVDIPNDVHHAGGADPG